MANNCIVLGFGDHGLTVMKDLLRDSSKRGLLRLRYDSINSSENIDAVRFFHCETKQSATGLESDEGMFPDLYSAISAISAKKIRARSDETLDQIIDAAKLLLQTGGDSVATPTLDLFIISQFSEENQLVEIDTFLVALIDRLNHLSTFSSPVGPQNLNIVGFYDFASLTDTSQESGQLRSALLLSEKGWIKRQDKVRSKALSRIYITDQVNDKKQVRSARARRLQTIAFLQLLIFEKLEPAERASLIRSGSGSLDSFISSFGIEVVETGVESLCRLAAANYMSKRLNYLTDNSLRIEGHGRIGSELNVTKALDQFQLDNSSGQNNLAAFELAFVAQLQDIESDVIESALGDSLPLDFEEYQDKVSAAKLIMIGEVANEVRSLETKLITPLSKNLSVAIDKDLAKATPIGYILEQLNTVQNNLAKRDSSLNFDSRKLTIEVSNLNLEFKRRYHRLKKYKKLHLNLSKNRWLWFIFPIWLSVLLTPSLTYSIDRLLGLWHTSASNSYVQAVFNFFAQNPIVVFLICIVLNLLLSVAGMRFVSAHLQKSFEWFLNAEQGRLVESLRMATTQGPHFEAVSINYKRAVLKGFRQTLSNNIERLKKRISEAQWLERKLIEYYDDDLRSEKSGADVCVYSIINAQSSLDQIQDILPATPVSVTKIAEDEGVPNVFINWEERFQRNLLSPLAVIDRTSGHYRSRFENENRSEFKATFKRRSSDFFTRITQKFSANVNALGEARSFAFRGEEFAAITDPAHHLRVNFNINETAELGSPGKLYLVKVVTSLRLAEKGKN